MLSSVYKWRLFFIASHPVFAVNNKQYNTILWLTASFTRWESSIYRNLKSRIESLFSRHFATPQVASRLC